MPRIFISYSRSDADFVRKLESDLSDLGFDVLLDKKHLRGGRSTTAEIRGKIGQSDYLIAVMTSNSVRSKWVRPVEIAWALKLQKEGRRLKILPLLLKESRSTFHELAALNYVDFTDGYALALARLVQVLPDTEYDEIYNLRQELDQEQIQERSLLSILRRVASRPRKLGRRLNWPALSARKLMHEVRRVIKNEKSADSAYWWLIIYGVLRFKNIDRFWDRKDKYQDSVSYAEISPRGAVLMEDLSTENFRSRSRPQVRRGSSSAALKTRHRTKVRGAKPA